MVRYRAAHAATVALLAWTTAVAGASAASAQELPCSQAVERAWQDAGIGPDKVRETVAANRHQNKSGVGQDKAVHAVLGSCQGTLIVHVSANCHVRQMYTTGDCSLPGVPSYP